MIAIGQYHTLTIDRLSAPGLYLTNGTDTVLLPKKWVTRNMLPGTTLNVFVYLDNEERPIATTLKPFACVNEFARLRVRQVNDAGAFLDWGIEKDVLVPFREQNETMEEDRYYVVYIYIDSLTGRLIASAKLNRFLKRNVDTCSEGDTVSILVTKETDRGFEVIVDQAYKGIVYFNEIFEPIRVGDKRTAYIHKIREDQKLDIRLKPKDYGISDDAKEKVIEILKQHNGFLALHDKSSPAEIEAMLTMSKKVFKKAIGGLFKEHKIEILENGVRLLPDINS